MRDDQTVTARLLEAGKCEFLEHGYEKASLRKICAKAGVTTGALYFFFQNKEDLFEQIVGETVSSLEELAGKLTEEELQDSSVGVENEKILLEFFWKNQDVMHILLEKSRGTKYAKISNEVMQELEYNFERFFQKYGSVPDKELIHILASMKMRGYMELMAGGYTLEKTLELAEKVGWYTEAGFECLMEKLRSKNAENLPAADACSYERM